MTDNKNMLKTHNNRVGSKAVTKKNYYAVVEFTVKVKDDQGKDVSVTKSAVVKVENPTTRLLAKQELEAAAKSFKGKITYFGAFKNQ